MKTHDELDLAFDEAMHGIYNRALKEAGYPGTKFLNMLFTHRGVETARRLIHSTRVLTGYAALWELKRLDLTVEALIRDNERWHPLFTEKELAICRKRLQDYGYPEVPSRLND